MQNLLALLHTKIMVILDTKKEKLEGETLLLIDPEKVAILAVERSNTSSGAQKFGIRISGVGFSYFFHISFSLSSKLEISEQKKFLMKLQARLAKKIWKDSSLEVHIASEHMGI